MHLLLLGLVLEYEVCVYLIRGLPCVIVLLRLAVLVSMVWSSTIALMIGRETSSHSQWSSFLCFPQCALSSVHLIANYLQYLLILTLHAAGCACLPYLEFRLVHYEKAGVACVVAHIRVSRLLWRNTLDFRDIIIVLGRLSVVSKILTNYARRWLHLGDCDHAIDWCWQSHPLHALTWLQVVLLLLAINHIRTVIFPEIRIILTF